MPKFRVGVSVSRGNGQTDTDEEVIELDHEDRKELEHTLWTMLDNMGVSTWWEEVEE